MPFGVSPVFAEPPLPEGGRVITGDIEVDGFDSIARLTGQGVATIKAAIGPILQGEQGPPGEDGQAGPPGERGVDGVIGRDGAPGAPGEAGADGLDGFPGIPGPQGAQGIAGAAGAPGIPGYDGDTGGEGPPGAQGLDGQPGAQGAAGTPGPPGEPGEQGDAGFPGIPGPQGAAGTSGTSGIDGAPGSDGLDGLDGFPGIPGPQGAQGVRGADGNDGVPGEPGIDGESGFPGIPGPQGAQGIQGPQGVPGLGIPGEQGAPGEDGVVIAQQSQQPPPYSEQTDTSVGSLNDFALGPLTNSLQMNGVTDVALTGMVGGAEGRRLWIRCGGSIETLRIKNDSTSSVAANRFRTHNDLDLVLRARDVVEVYYTNGRWIPVTRARDWMNTLAVTWAAAQNDLAIAGADRIRVLLTGSQSLTGVVPLVANASNDGQTLLIENRDDVDTLTIENDSASSTANNRILCPGAAGFALGPRCGVSLRYDGTTLAWRIVTPYPGIVPFSDLTQETGQLDYRRSRRRHWLWEDFDFVGPVGSIAAATTLSAGCSNWSIQPEVATGSIAQGGSTNAGRPGVLTMTTGATNGNGMTLWKGSSTAGGWAQAGTIDSYEVDVLISSAATSGYIVGAIDNAAANGFYFRFDTAVLGVNINAVCVAAGVATTVDLGVAPSAGALGSTSLTQLRCVNATAGVEFYLGGILKATISTNRPAAGQNLNFTVQAITRANVTRTVSVDFIHYELTT